MFKKKVLATALALVMCLSISVTGFAAPPDYGTVNGETWTNDGYSSNSTAPVFTFSCVPEAENVQITNPFAKMTWSETAYIVPIGTVITTEHEYRLLINKFTSDELNTANTIFYEEQEIHKTYTFSEEGTYAINSIMAEKDIIYVRVLGGSGENENTPQPTNASITVLFQGTALNFDLPIVNRDGRTFYPMRQLLEAMGADVDWVQETRTAIGTLNGNKVEFDIDSATYRVNSVAQQMDTTAFVENGRTYIPIRYAAEGLGFTVSWDSNTNTIAIN